MPGAIVYRKMTGASGALMAELSGYADAGPGAGHEALFYGVRRSAHAASILPRGEQLAKLRRQSTVEAIFL